MIYGIKICGNQSNVLDVSLADVLNCVEPSDNVQWSVLWITAVGQLDTESIVDFEKRVKESTNGLRVARYVLEDLAKRTEQILEIILIGDEFLDNLRRYDDDSEMYSSCSYTIELVDSSYWLVHSDRKHFIDKIKEVCSGVQNL